MQLSQSPIVQNRSFLICPQLLLLWPAEIIQNFKLLKYILISSVLAPSQAFPMERDDASVYFQPYVLQHFTKSKLVYMLRPLLQVQ